MSQKSKKKKQIEEIAPTSLKQKILLNILAVVIVLIAGSITFIAIGQYRVKHAGAKDKDKLIQNYITAMNDINKNSIKQCYYPYQPDMKNYEIDIDRQIQYAQNEKMWKKSHGNRRISKQNGKI